MKKTTYECDLCEREFEPEDLKGIHWFGSESDQKIKRVGACESNTHLCKSCINAIKQTEW